MKKIIMFPIFIASVVLIILGIIWINAYNGEVTRNNLIEKNRGDVHAALGSRYDKYWHLLMRIKVLILP